MELKQYLISENDYLAHIDGQIKMYDHVLTLANETRKLLLDGKFAALLRTLNQFEHEANEIFLEWGISDDYLCGGDPKALRGLMQSELLEVEDDGCPAINRFLRPCCQECGAAAEKGGTEGRCGA